MAKQNKRDPAPAADPLTPAMTAFSDGDYVAARAAFDALKTDERLTEGDRAIASELFQATRVDRLTLYVGLACLALFIVAVTLTSAVQP